MTIAFINVALITFVALPLNNGRSARYKIFPVLAGLFAGVVLILVVFTDQPPQLIMPLQVISGVATVLTIVIGLIFRWPSNKHEEPNSPSESNHD